MTDHGVTYTPDRYGFGHALRIQARIIFAIILLIAALLAAIGLDPLTAISGSITAVANVGPGMGPVIGPSTNFASLPDAAKWILSFGMLLGRLEILTVAVLFFPSFWKQ